MGVNLSVIVCWLSLRVANKFSVPPISLLTFALKPVQTERSPPTVQQPCAHKAGKLATLWLWQVLSSEFSTSVFNSLCTLPCHVFTWGQTEPRSCIFEEEFDGWSPPHKGEPAQTFAHQTWKETSKAEKREWYNTESCYSFVSSLRGNHAHF